MPARQIFFILPRRVVCASVRSDASMAALVRTAAARRGRTEGWDIGKGGAGVGAWRYGGGASTIRKNPASRGTEEQEQHNTLPSTICCSFLLSLPIS